MYIFQRGDGALHVPFLGCGNLVSDQPGVNKQSTYMHTSIYVCACICSCIFIFDTHVPRISCYIYPAPFVARDWEASRVVRHGGSQPMAKSVAVVLALGPLGESYEF